MRLWERIPAADVPMGWASTTARSSQGISSAQLYDMLPAIPRDTLMGVINEMLKHNRLDVFRPKPGVALFKEFPHGEGLKCAGE